MPANNNPIRKTPYIFLRNLVLIEFIFAFLPFMAALILPIQAEYNETGLAQNLSYTMLLVIFLTTLQIFILAIAFFSWYLPLYQIDRQRVTYRRAGAVDYKELITTATMERVEIHQGILGRRFDYGTLLIYGNARDQVVRLKDIPDPFGTANKLENWSTDQPKVISPTMKTPKDLIAGGEGQFVEFKSSLLWDYRQEKLNKKLSIPIIKNVAAFMNTAGGTLLVGINDDSKVLGLEPDYAVMKKPNPDGFELIFNNAFNQMIGAEYRHFVQLLFPEIEGKSICLIDVQPSTSPVYFRYRDKEEFYIRAGNISQPLLVSKAAAYIQDHYQL